MKSGGAAGREPRAGFPAACLVLGLLLAACNGGGDGAPVVPGDPERDVIGKWILREYHSAGYLKLGTLTYPLDEDRVFTDDRSYIDLKADHTFVSDLPDPGSEGGTTVELGTWSLSGRTLTTIGSVDGEGEPDTLDWNVALTGADVVFSYGIDEKDGISETKQDVVIKAVKR